MGKYGNSLECFHNQCNQDGILRVSFRFYVILCRILCYWTDGHPEYYVVRNIVWMRKLVNGFGMLWLSRAWWPVPWICDAAFLCQAWQLPFWNLIAFAKPGKIREWSRMPLWEQCGILLNWYTMYNSGVLRMTTSTVISHVINKNLKGVWALFKDAVSILSILWIYPSLNPHFPWFPLFLYYSKARRTLDLQQHFFTQESKTTECGLVALRLFLWALRMVQPQKWPKTFRDGVLSYLYLQKILWMNHWITANWRICLSCRCVCVYVGTFIAADSQSLAVQFNFDIQ